MACALTLNGLILGCRDNSGGVKEVYICDRNQLNLSGVLFTANVITTLPFSVGSTSKFLKYFFKKETANLTTKIESNDTNGTVKYTSTLALKFNKTQTTTAQEIQNLAKGQLAIIILDNNGRYSFLGYDNEVVVKEGNAETGTNLIDMNGYTISFEDIAKALPFEISSSIISGLF
jgi:hypothetical protein